MSKYVIVDLEMCNIPERVQKNIYNLKRELIQIGAVLIDDTLNITDEFITYVFPEFGVIDTYIENLTGISKKDVQYAPHFKEALEMFADWLPKDAVLVSWSDNDKAQIKKELEAKRLVVNGLMDYLDSWIDCQEMFGEKLETTKNYKLSEALILADIDYNEGEHDALVDARNTAQLFVKIKSEAKLVLNPYYSNQTEDTYNPFAELLSNYNPDD